MKSCHVREVEEPEGHYVRWRKSHLERQRHKFSRVGAMSIDAVVMGSRMMRVWEEQVWREHGGQRWCQGLGREGVETVWANHVTAIDCLSQNSWWEGL